MKNITSDVEPSSAAPEQPLCGLAPLVRLQSFFLSHILHYSTALSVCVCVFLPDSLPEGLKELSAFTVLI